MYTRGTSGAIAITCDEELVRRLPLPLAQLYRRAHNSKTHLERHQTAYYLWEASVKLLASVAVVEYAELSDQDPEICQRLENLARPSLGHWWEFVRRLVPILAGRGQGDQQFQVIRDLVLGRTRHDLPRAAGLDVYLCEALGASDGSLSMVRMSELFDRLVRYRNQEFGHGAAGQRARDFYQHMGRALLAGISEILSRLDVLAGGELIFIADVRRQPSGNWLVERYGLAGETARRMESVELPEEETTLRIPRPGRIYLQAPAGRKAVHSLHPLVLYDQETGEFFFLNARRGQLRSEYLCYSTGAVVDRKDLGAEHRELLARILGGTVNEEAAAGWAQWSQVEELPPPREEEGPARRRIGEFELLSRIGRGGMGVVYRAWQPSLERQVALKCLFSACDQKVEARFAREIRALGRVEHPHLVKIFTSGSDGDHWFYAMELIEGANLERICDQLKGSSASEVGEVEWQKALSSAFMEARKGEEPMSPDPETLPHSSTERKEAPSPVLGMKRGIRGEEAYIGQVVEIMRQVVRAAHTLHQAGVIHRDIKPGNIMLAADGSHAVLMDLGLAQLADDAEGRLTRTRQFVGTLRYASPEQVLAAGTLDRRSDVYSLGATLWELLALRPLFGANQETPTPDLMLRIQTKDPEALRKYNPQVPPDLEAIVLKCLEKDPARRYGTASDLADDLDRFVRGETVYAQPPTLRYVLGKYVRRHRWKIAVVLTLLIAGLAGLALSFYRIDRARWKTELALFDLYTSSGLNAADQGDPARGFLWFANAAYLAPNDLQRQLSNRVRLHTFSRTIPTPVRAFRHEGWNFKKISFHKSEKYLLVLAHNSRCAIWDLEEEKHLPLPGGERPVGYGEWSPDGRWLALGTPEGEVGIFRFPEGEKLQTFIHSGPIQTLTFSPDGRFLALAGSSARVWDCREKRYCTQELTHSGPVQHLIFNSRGDRLATISIDRKASVYSLSESPGEATLLFTPVDHIVTPRKPGIFAAGDRAILILNLERRYTWIDAKTGVSIRSLPFKNFNNYLVPGVGIVPDSEGRFLVLTSDQQAMIWDVAIGAPIGSYLEHRNWIENSEFSPDRRMLLAANQDRTVRIWSVPQGKPLSPLIPHQHNVVTVTFSPSGIFFATADNFGLIRIWQYEYDISGDYRITKFSETLVELSPDGNHFMPTGHSQWLSFLTTTQVYEVKTGIPAGRELKVGGIVLNGAFSPDGSQVVTLSSLKTEPSERHPRSPYRREEHPGLVQFWNWRTGERILDPQETPSEPLGVAYNQDGRKVIVLCAGGEIFLLDSASEAILKQLDHGEQIKSRGLFPRIGTVSPDRRYFVTSGLGNTAKVVDLESGEILHSLEHEDHIQHAQFTPDGSHIVTASSDNTAAVWDLSTGKAISRLSHQDFVWRVCASPSGRYVLTSCRDHMAHLWDWRREQISFLEMAHNDEVFDGNFSPDGRWILTVTRGGLLIVWEDQTGKPVSPPLALHSPGLQISITPDGNYAVVPTSSTGIHVFHLKNWIKAFTYDLDLADLRTLAEINSGQRIRKREGVFNLTSSEWIHRWQTFREKHPKHHVFDCSRDRILAWHRHWAEFYENEMDWNAALWHLERLNALGEEIDQKRISKFHEFVRGWRFSALLESWNNHKDFVPMDQEKLNRIEELARTAILVKSPESVVDFAHFLREKTTNVAGYASREIVTDRARTLNILAGSDDALRIWLNGTVIHRNRMPRAARPDEDRVSAELKPGRNTLTVEVSQGFEGWRLYLRLEDPDGKKLRLLDDGRLEPLE